MRVTVIGGGVIGWPSAWSLARRGADVDRLRARPLRRRRVGRQCGLGHARALRAVAGARRHAPGGALDARRRQPAARAPARRSRLPALEPALRSELPPGPAPHRDGRDARARAATAPPLRPAARRGRRVRDARRRPALPRPRRARRSRTGCAHTPSWPSWASTATSSRWTARGVAALEPAVGDGVGAGLLARSRAPRAPRDAHRRARRRPARAAASRSHEHVGRHRRSRRRARTGTAPTGGSRPPAARLDADAVVVAAGVWSRELLQAPGVEIPLEAAKGYSVTAPAPDPSPRPPAVPDRGEDRREPVRRRAPAARRHARAGGDRHATQPPPGRGARPRGAAVPAGMAARRGTAPTGRGCGR